MKHPKRYLILQITLFVMLMVAIGYIGYKISQSFTLFQNNNYDFFSIIVPLAIGFSISLISYLLNIKIEEKNNEEINIRYEKIKTSVISENSTPEKNTDILELMLANMREINDYYILSKTQAQKSFTLAVFMCIIGIILMGVSIVAAFFQDNNVISAIIPAIGAAIVEVIAGTSLFVYKKSLSQLNRYFNSLHSNERFLSIVNIVSKVSPEKQDDMYFEIIKSQIGLVSTDLIENTNAENRAK